MTPDRKLTEAADATWRAVTGDTVTTAVIYAERRRPRWARLPLIGRLWRRPDKVIGVVNLDRRES